MAELVGVEKCRRNLCCMLFRYYLFNCENLTYQRRNYRWKLKLTWNFICKSVYFIHFNCQTVCFCLNIGLLYVHLRPFTDCQGKKGQFSSIFTCVSKWSCHFVSFKLSLFKNRMQHKLRCHSLFLTSQFQHVRRNCSRALIPFFIHNLMLFYRRNQLLLV